MIEVYGHSKMTKVYVTIRLLLWTQTLALCLFTWSVLLPLQKYKNKNHNLEESTHIWKFLRSSWKCFTECHWKMLALWTLNICILKGWSKLVICDYLSVKYKLLVFWLKLGLLNVILRYLQNNNFNLLFKYFNY